MAPDQSSASSAWRLASAGIQRLQFETNVRTLVESHVKQHGRKYPEGARGPSRGQRALDQPLSRPDLA